MPLTPNDSLLIVCRAFAPFVTVQLLVKPAGGPAAPAPGAGATPLPPIANRLALLDEQYDLHSIMFVMNRMAQDCYDRGYDLAVGAADLLGPTAQPTLGGLAGIVQGSNPL